MWDHGDPNISRPQMCFGLGGAGFGVSIPGTNPWRGFWGPYQAQFWDDGASPSYGTAVTPISPIPAAPEPSPQKEKARGRKAPGGPKTTRGSEAAEGGPRRAPRGSVQSESSSSSEAELPYNCPGAPEHLPAITLLEDKAAPRRGEANHKGKGGRFGVFWGVLFFFGVVAASPTRSFLDFL